MYTLLVLVQVRCFLYLNAINSAINACCKDSLTACSSYQRPYLQLTVGVCSWTKPSTQVFSLCSSALNTQRSETVLTLVGPLTSASPNTAVLANPLLSPYIPPLFFSFPRDPSDLCTVTAQREDPVLRLPWQ